MADLSQVEDALGAAIGAALSTAFPSVPVRRNWPDPKALDAVVQAGGARVSIYSKPGATRNTTRYELKPTTIQGTPTLTVTVAGDRVVFGGTGGAGQVIGVLLGGASGQSYAYRLGQADTPSTVATALAGVISGASAAGPVLTLPTSQIVARVVADGVSITEIQRQQQQITVTVWASSPTQRDQIASALSVALAALSLRPWLQVVPGEGVRVLFVSDASNDTAETAGLYRRELTYSAEYGTTIRETLPEMLFGIQDTSVRGTLISSLTS